ncbi:MAG: DUF3592 domain-containing protein, partial [Clostridia bacterium]|nr:DUF3592 domain-containing protein [Clostridia bacterium]
MKDEAKEILKRMELWVAIVALAIASGLWIFSIYYTVSTCRRISAYTHINATVIDHAIVDGSYHNGHFSGSTLAPIVEYTVDGKKYVAQDTMSSNIGKKIGSKREIAYNPDNPEECLFVKSQKSRVAFLFIFAAAVSTL